jgi:hypothetical protein
MNSVARTLLAFLVVGCSSSDSLSFREDAVTTCVDLPDVADANLKNPPMTQNLGSQPSMRVGARDESLLQFDLGALPRLAVIDSASLKIYVSGGGSKDSINVHRVTTAWSEESVTFASFAQHFDAAIAASFSVATGEQGLRSVDVRDLAAAWKAGTQPNHGVLLESESQQPAVFVSREGGTAAQKPVLRVCYSTPPDHCAAGQCQNGGTCENEWESYTCHCPAGFTGVNCEVNIDDCAGDPCLNGATCNDGVDGYSCSCAPGFAGTHCETNIDECAAAPCQNGGVCEDGIADYTCHCVPGYSGDDCEVLVDNCEAQPCQNGGTCQNAVNAYSCACAPGFTGTNCEIDIDDCAANPCRNGGTCIDGVNSYSCACPPDWGGATCDVNLSSCSQHPCLNGASCVNGYGTYTCGCAPGYTGTNCEIDIDECEGVTCENGGVCVDGVNQFTCQCAPEYIGRTCETVVPNWLQLSAGAGVATVVWRDLPNATGYGVTSDHPDQSRTDATCEGGVCAIQLDATDGTSAIAVSATSSVATSLIGNGSVEAVAGAPRGPRYASASSMQSNGVVTTTFSWYADYGQAPTGNTLRLRELDAASGALTTILSDTISSYDPYSCGFYGACYAPRTYCMSDYGLCQTSLTLPPGQHLYQLEIVGAARSMPIFTTIPGVDSTPPPAPTNLRVVSVTTTTATLAWDRSPATDVARYALRGVSAYNSYSGWSTSCDATTCRGTITDLYPGIDLELSVRAIDQAGNQSPDSAPVHTVCGSAVAMAAPSILSLVGDDNMLELRFETPGMTADQRPARYHVWVRPSAGGAERDAGQLAGDCQNLSYGRCRLFIESLSGGVPYTVQVQAEGAPGNYSPRSAGVEATPAARAPANIESRGCYNNGLTKVRVSFQPGYETSWTRLEYAPDVTKL